MKNLFMGLAVVGVVATASAFTVVTHDTDAEAPVLTYTADGLVDETGAVWKGCVSIWNGLGHKCEEPLGPGEDCEYQYLGDHGSRLGDPEGHDYENPNYECEEQ